MGIDRLIAADERFIEVLRRGGAPIGDPLGELLAAWRRTATGQDTPKTGPSVAATATEPPARSDGTAQHSQGNSAPNGATNRAAGPVTATPTRRRHQHHPEGTTMHNPAPTQVPQPIGDPTVPTMFRALADHLDTFPDLATPTSLFSVDANHDGHWILQVQLHRATRDAFDRWAESLGSHTRIVRGMARATGYISDVKVDLFDAGDWTV